ncbi:MAG: aldehyde dehydrogenase family protein, partial [Bdellovibrionota bacterium]|nr:aldehyde dehydrogenase family protein [Bdellovibrionota bacterium]
MLKKKMFIGGEWVEALSGEKRSIENPYDASQVAEVSEGSREDAKKAISEARKAFDGGWGQTGRKERQGLLLKLAELIKRDKEELANLESLNTGKTMEESRWDMDDIYNIFKFYAKLLDNDFTEKVQSPIPDSTSLVVKEPIGVCGQISPWNYPLLQASWKMAP